VSHVETDRAKIIRRLEPEDWELARHGSQHLYRRPDKPVVVVPRHRTLSPGVARAIAKPAGWL
jgi:predicted RNA binding protein YcfA (HicA-like mRNA interferase family)